MLSALTGKLNGVPDFYNFVVKDLQNNCDQI